MYKILLVVEDFNFVVQNYWYILQILLYYELFFMKLYVLLNFVGNVLFYGNMILKDVDKR